MTPYVFFGVIEIHPESMSTKFSCLNLKIEVEMVPTEKSNLYI